MFRTELSVSPSQGTIGLKDPIFTIGSCFSDAIGRQFAVNKFNILANPFGTIYNPVSIFKLLDYCLEDSGPNQDTFIIRDGLYLNYDFHSFFTAQSESELKGQLVQKIKNTRAYLKQTKYLIITLGTAYVYELRANKEVVANCHKQPQ
mgnify:FL=1